VSLALAPRPHERLTPLERLEVLCDPGSLHLLRTDVRSQRMGDKARAGDGVLAASGRVDGRPVFCFAQDGSFAVGSLGEAHANTVVRLYELAGRAQVPVIGFIESAGARMQEGLAALAGYGRIFREQVRLSGEVPQISIVCGPSAGGGCYGPALTDFVIMAGDRSSMFLTGPGVVAKVTGEEVDAAALGGPRVHERNGVCHLSAPTEVDGTLLARDLLDYLPQNAGERVMRWPTVDAPGFLPDACVPREERRVYDIRDVARALVDGGRLLEISPRYARNVLCALARLDGRAVGVLANQPRHLGGVLDANASQKAARFVRTCNLFGLPLVVLVDTPGFLPGTGQEHSGVIRHGAKLVHAFAEATVPRVTVLVRKAFGGAFIAMNSKDLGADFVFAWPSARLGVMGAAQAVEIINRREIEAAGDADRARDALADAYAAQHLAPGAASGDGFVDEIIPPSDTRARIAAAFASLETNVPERATARNLPL
jgi:acetyl-CoA carboxylase carboxyltransferase component